MQLKTNINEEAAHELVGVLQGVNDIVRIVDPETREVLFWPTVGAADIMSGSPCAECNAVWGRGERCPNCTSLEALRLMERTFKMEISNNHAFWVQSRPMVMDARPCVLEIVNDVTDGLMVEGGERGAVTDLIESLNGLISTDPLTGLFNRRFLDEFTQRVADLERAGQCVNVAMLDLDDMKDINDSFGHPAGDAVLKDVSGFLRLNFGSLNTDEQRWAVRYGGDEFLVIDVGTDAGEFTRDVLEHYRQMRRVCYFGAQEIPFSLSIGVASSDDFGWNWDALLDAADQRMYAEKRARDSKATDGTLVDDKCSAWEGRME